MQICIKFQVCLTMYGQGGLNEKETGLNLRIESQNRIIFSALTFNLFC